MSDGSVRRGRTRRRKDVKHCDGLLEMRATFLFLFFCFAFYFVVPFLGPPSLPPSLATTATESGRVGGPCHFTKSHDVSSTPACWGVQKRQLLVPAYLSLFD